MSITGSGNSGSEVFPAIFAIGLAPLKAHPAHQRWLDAHLPEKGDQLAAVMDLFLKNVDQYVLCGWLNIFVFVILHAEPFLQLGLRQAVEISLHPVIYYLHEASNIFNAGVFVEASAFRLRLVLQNIEPMFRGADGVYEYVPEGVPAGFSVLCKLLPGKTGQSLEVPVPDLAVVFEKTFYIYHFSRLPVALVIGCRS